MAIHSVSHYTQQLDAIEHPGDLLNRLIHDAEYTRERFANTIGISVAQVGQLINRTRRISPRRAIMLSKAFPQFSADFWITQQALYDLRAEQAKKLPMPKIKPVAKPGTHHELRPSPDRCLCGDWGWQHMREDGGCSICPCPVFMKRQDTLPVPITIQELNEVWEEVKKKKKAEADAAAEAARQAKRAARGLNPPVPKKHEDQKDDHDREQQVGRVVAANPDRPVPVAATPSREQDEDDDQQ